MISRNLHDDVNEDDDQSVVSLKLPAEAGDIAGNWREFTWKIASTFLSFTFLSFCLLVLWKAFKQTRDEKNSICSAYETLHWYDFFSRFIHSLKSTLCRLLGFPRSLLHSNSPQRFLSLNFVRFSPNTGFCCWWLKLICRVLMHKRKRKNGKRENWKRK